VHPRNSAQLRTLIFRQDPLELLAALLHRFAHFVAPGLELLAGILAIEIAGGNPRTQVDHLSRSILTLRNDLFPQRLELIHLRAAQLELFTHTQRGFDSECPVTHSLVAKASARPVLGKCRHRKYGHDTGQNCCFQVSHLCTHGLCVYASECGKWLRVKSVADLREISRQQNLSVVQLVSRDDVRECPRRNRKSARRPAPQPRLGGQPCHQRDRRGAYGRKLLS
jgi:hypothetical protein